MLRDLYNALEKNALNHTEITNEDMFEHTPCREAEADEVVLC